MRYHSELSINLNSLKFNFEQLKLLAPNNQVIFMVKGDAYGHGLEDISKFAFSEMNIVEFGVACLGEAVKLRNILGPKVTIYVFSDLELEGSCHKYFEDNLIPVLSTMKDLKLFTQHKEYSDSKFCLKFNTGMNRLGFKENEVDLIMNFLRSKNIQRIEHIMSHLSHSFFQIREGDKSHKQYIIFKRIKESLSSQFSVKSSSISNSGAIEQGFGLEESHIRPGIMLYGPASFGSIKPPVGRIQNNRWRGRIISELRSKILSKEKILKGTPIGYGGSICGSNGYLITLPIGYADGFLTYYGGVKFSYKGIDFKVIGRLNMDLCFVHSDTIKTEDVEELEWISFWDDSQKSITDFCTQTKTIPYQVFTALSSRIPRKYYYK